MKHFLNAEEYNQAINGSRKFNCFAAALGITAIPSRVTDFNIEGSDIGASFKKLAYAFNIPVREVKSLEEAKGNYTFIVLGYFPVWVDYVLYKEKQYVDFHVFRINPDGTIFNKMDAKSPAKDLADIYDPQLEDYLDEIKSGKYRVFVPDE